MYRGVAPSGVRSKWHPMMHGSSIVRARASLTQSIQSTNARAHEITLVPCVRTCWESRSGFITSSASRKHRYSPELHRATRINQMLLARDLRWPHEPLLNRTVLSKATSSSVRSVIRTIHDRDRMLLERPTPTLDHELRAILHCARESTDQSRVTSSLTCNIQCCDHCTETLALDLGGVVWQSSVDIHRAMARHCALE